jgi:hypothetical protein
LVGVGVGVVSGVAAGEGPGDKPWPVLLAMLRPDEDLIFEVRPGVSAEPEAEA